MKNWSGVYNKYKDSELMKEFRKYFIDKRRSKRIFAYLDIKDIWGYLICFAETKGIYIYIDKKPMDEYGDQINWEYEIEDHNTGKCYIENFETSEQAMLWCATKFFEINDKVENE